MTKAQPLPEGLAFAPAFCILESHVTADGTRVVTRMELESISLVARPIDHAPQRTQERTKP